MQSLKSRQYSLVILILITLVSITACGQSPASTIRLGDQAPDFILEAVRGGAYHLQELQGKVVVLSFLNSQSRVLDAPDSSRSQIVFLKSMSEQYGPKGVVVLIVDATRIISKKQPAKDDLINFTYDWQLDDIPVLMDPEGATARLYGVSSTPTTFLIKSDGTVGQRWDGMASAAQLALAIEALVGAPAYRQTGDSTPAQPTVSCTDETPPQAKFAGVGLARSLSDEIWVVDSGQAWGSGGAFPLQWILVDNQNLTGAGQVTLVVLGRYSDSDQPLELVNQAIQPLPSDEAQGLVIGRAGGLPRVYLLPILVYLERTGCLHLEAYVFREGDETAIYLGRATIPVK